MIRLVDSNIEQRFAPHPFCRVEPYSAVMVISDYIGLSYHAIQWLISAAVSTKALPGIHVEIMANIDEELGKHTEGVPHLEIMRKGYQDIGINVEAAGYRPATREFFQKMNLYFMFPEPIRVAGAVYALEATAPFEFLGLRKLFKGFCAHRGVKMPSDLQSYVEHHILAEEHHAQGLRDAITPYLNETNQAQFLQGALDVLSAMEDWLSAIVI